MTATNGLAQQVAEAYAQAWTSGDVDKAMTYLADDIVCDAPAGRVEGVAAYRPFTQEFVDVLTQRDDHQGAGRRHQRGDRLQL
jgi:ketosteroid isomerase-like protein